MSLGLRAAIVLAHATYVYRNHCFHVHTVRIEIQKSKVINGFATCYFTVKIFADYGMLGSFIARNESNVTISASKRDTNAQKFLYIYLGFCYVLHGYEGTLSFAQKTLYTRVRAPR
jgi:hypothetical protein